MENYTLDIRNTNIYKKAYAKHEDLEESKRLRDKFTDKPYRIRFKTLRKLSLSTTVICNILSAATACIAVYFFLDEMLPHFLLSAVITIVLLGILETAKRITGKTLFMDYYKKKGISFLHGFILVGLTATSIALSYHGGKRTAHQFIQEPDLYSAVEYGKTEAVEISRIDEQIEKARNTTYKGITTVTSQRTIEKLTDQRKEVQDRLFQMQLEVLNTNKEIQSEFEIDRASKGQLFAMVTIFIEMLFLCSLFYVEHYDHESYKELPTGNVDNHLMAMGELVYDQPPSKAELEMMLNKMSQEQMKQTMLLIKDEMDSLRTLRKKTLAEKQTIQIKEAPPKKTINLATQKNHSSSKLPENNFVQTKKETPYSKAMPKNDAERLLQIQQLKKELRTARNRLSQTKGRLAKGVGDADRHQANIEKALAVIAEKETALANLEN